MKLADVKTSKKVATKGKAKGYIVYEGASRINGDDIVVIVTMKSANTKTGDLPTMWILHKDLKPTEASKAGKDEAMCGGCKLRQSLGGACYVNLGHGPRAVFQAYKNGAYKQLDGDYEVFSGLKMRFGAYGDPYAMPLDILIQIKSRVKNAVGYTHQWRNDKGLSPMTMASVDSPKEALTAQKAGWRTFRVATPESDIMDNEIVCPNYTTGVQCADCNLCSGNTIEAKNIVIPVHGSWKKRFNA